MFLLKLFNIVLSKSVFIPFDMDLCDFFQGHRGQLTNGLDFSVGGENCPYLFHCKGVHVNLCSNLLRIKTSPYYLLLKWMTKLILVVNRSNLAWDLKLPKSWVMSSHFPLFPGLLRAGRPSTCALLRTPCSFETRVSGGNNLTVNAGEIPCLLSAWFFNIKRKYQTKIESKRKRKKKW